MTTTLTTSTPTTSTLTTSTLTTTPSTTTTERTTDRLTWTCPNCRGETTTTRKRCTDCGTSRW